MNTGIPYELVARAIFQEILDLESARTISVQHNVVEQGRTTTHQIDVLWRFSVGGIDYTTVVQCKDWGSRVAKSAVLAFHAVLDDLPGQPRGLIVTRSGFQSGARKLADSLGIKAFRLTSVPLLHVRMDTNSWATVSMDPQERLFRTVVYRPVIRSTFWAVEDAALRPTRRGIKCRLRHLELSNAAKKPLGTVDAIATGFLTEMRGRGNLSGTFTKTFDKATFLRLPRRASKFRLKAISFEIKIEVEPQPPVLFPAPGVSSFILEDLQTGQTSTHGVACLRLSPEK